MGVGKDERGAKKKLNNRQGVIHGDGAIIETAQGLVQTANEYGEEPFIQDKAPESQIPQCSFPLDMRLDLNMSHKVGRRRLVPRHIPIALPFSLSQRIQKHTCT